MTDEPTTRPSNFVLFALIVVTAVVVWFGWASFYMPRHRSADQKILIDKSKQH